MSAKQIILLVCVVLISINSASAKSWRGIEPLHSTRADVERLFGLPVDKMAGIYQCGEYKYAAPVAPGTNLKRIGHYPFDEFGNIRYEDAQARLDNFVIQLYTLQEREPEWRGYIALYTRVAARALVRLNSRRTAIKIISCV